MVEEKEKRQYFIFQKPPIFICNMLLLYILIMCKIKTVSLYGFNMFDINDRQDGYCLSFHKRYFSSHLNLGRDPSYIHQTMLYCIRSFQEKNSMIDNGFKNTIYPSFTFAALKEQNITSNILLGWSASIELA
jgi:hypothetical protein